MNVLIIGGTRFLGYQLAWRLIAGGHPVTLFNRGRQPDRFGERVQRLRGDRTTDDFARLLRNRSFDAAVDFAKADRAPLFFIAGEKDHIMPSSVNRANAKLYRSGTIAFREFPGRDHFIAGEEGWEEVATAALDWALDPQPTAIA